MNDEFQWWLLIVGLVVGAGLTWLVLADSTRREVDIEERELESESRWIADEIAATGRPIDRRRVLEILHLHRAYRGAAPPDDPDGEGTQSLEADANDDIDLRARPGATEPGSIARPGRDPEPSRR